MEPQAGIERQLAHTSDLQTDELKSNQQSSKTTTQTDDQGPIQQPASDKENLEGLSTKLCFTCKRSLSKSAHLIKVAGKQSWWHPECFRCDMCSVALDREASCHLYKDRIVCRDDYAKLQRNFSVKCSRCHWSIGASDWVRRAGDYVYHLACFTCDICQRQLSTGEQFTLRVLEDKKLVRLLCRLHFGAGSSSTQATASSSSPMANQQASGQRRRNNQHWQQFMDSSTGASFNQYHPSSRPVAGELLFEAQAMQAANTGSLGDEYLQLLANQVGENVAASLLAAHATPGPELEVALTPGSDFGSTMGASSSPRGGGLMSQKAACQLGSPTESALGANGPSTGTSSGSSSSGGVLAGGSKSKRVRTTFTEEQLAILHNQFERQPNPDGQELDHIAAMTGLTKRVTQVWFQNSRARQKKYMVKRKPNSSSNRSSSPMEQVRASAFEQPAHLCVPSNHQTTSAWDSSTDGGGHFGRATDKSDWSVLDRSISLRQACSTQEEQRPKRSGRINEKSSPFDQLASNESEQEETLEDDEQDEE